MSCSFTLRAYGLLLDQGRVLVSDELIRGQRITKFPGGGLEYGEGLKDCLVREVREELGAEAWIPGTSTPRTSSSRASSTSGPCRWSVSTSPSGWRTREL